MHIGGGGTLMGVKESISKVLARAWEIILVSALLAICAGIGSLLTQYQLKMTLDFNLMAWLMAIFFVMVAFCGVVFAIVTSRRHFATH
jgi:hypothetical protein